MNENITIGTMPILALRGLVVFPEQTVHFEVGRVKSVLALEEAMKKDQTFLLMPQKDISKDDPERKDLYAMGTVAKVKQILRGSGETIRVLVTGLYRARIQELTQFEPYLCGVVASVPVTELMDNLSARALRREANALYGLYVQMIEHPAQAVHPAGYQRRIHRFGPTAQDEAFSGGCHCGSLRFADQHGALSGPYAHLLYALWH